MVIVGLQFPTQLIGVLYNECVCPQSCLTLWQPHGLYSPPGSSVHGIFPGKNTPPGKPLKRIILYISVCLCTNAWEDNQGLHAICPWCKGKLPNVPNRKHVWHEAGGHRAGLSGTCYRHILIGSPGISSLAALSPSDPEVGHPTANWKFRVYDLC